MRRAGAVYEPVDRAASTPTCASRPTPPTRSAAPCCSSCRSAARRSRRSCCSSSSSGRRSPTSAPRSCWPTDGLDFARHYLENGAPLPAAPAERARGAAPRREVRERRGAWTRLFSEVTSAITVGCRTRTTRSSLEVALVEAAGARPGRAPQAAAEAITAGLAPGLRTRAFIFNTLLHDKAVDDRLRSYPTGSRPQPRQRGKRRVGAGAGRGGAARNDIPQRWYTLKARLLGVDRLADYDRVARGRRGRRARAVGRGARARDRLLRGLLARARRIVRRFFDERYIDAPVRPGKRGGAFCAYTVP